MIDLKDLRHLIVGEINKAEKQVIKDVHLSLGNAKEDEITTLFVVGAERGLMEATESGRVAAAVLHCPAVSLAGRFDAGVGCTFAAIVAGSSA